MQKDIRLPVFSLSETCEILGVSKYVFETKLRYHLTRLEKRNGKDVFLQEEVRELEKSIIKNSFEIIS